MSIALGSKHQASKATPLRAPCNVICSEMMSGKQAGNVKTTSLLAHPMMDWGGKEWLKTA